MMSACARRLAIVLVVAALPACYRGTAHDASPRKIAADPTWSVVKDVPFVQQRAEKDCGAAALAMVLQYWHIPATLDGILAQAPPVDGGIRAGELRDLARSKGLEAFVVQGTMLDLVDQIGKGRPVLVGLAKPMASGRAAAHYEVVVGVNRPKKLILTLDPDRGMRENSAEGFAREWIPTHQVTLIVFPKAPAPAAVSSGG